MHKILLVGSGAREHAIARAIKRSAHPNLLFCVASHMNPGIQELCSVYHISSLHDIKNIASFAAQQQVDFVIIGPELPLSLGLVDLLKRQYNIPAIGPTQTLVQIETSKGFARDLLKNHAYNEAASFLPKYRWFTALDEVNDFLQTLGDNFVIKANGLMGGKGVKVAQEHLFSHTDALTYCQELLAKNFSFVVEEKFIGQEFSLLSFCDGKHLAHMPVVQDHKRAFIGDTGPNTGGMGSYSTTDHALPFLSKQDVEKAKRLNQITIEVLAQKLGELYQGIIYGGFMLTKDGVKLIEYNARFGDPEAINLLALLDSDFIAVCLAIIAGELDRLPVTFTQQATVCKYLVPEGYPDHPRENVGFDVTEVENKEQLYFATMNVVSGKLCTAGSRTLAVLGIASNISAAEKMAEETAQKITGPLFHRSDIGSNELINKKIIQINQLCNRSHTLL